MSSGPEHYVLLIESDSKETEHYSNLIREVADCKIDVVSRIDGMFDWIARSSYHIVILDLSELSGEGLGILERIKRVSPSTSVILVSDQANIEQAVAAIRLGAEDYFHKPFNVETFKLAIKRALDRKMVFGESDGASGFLNLLNSCQMISSSLEQGKIFKTIKSYVCRELDSNHAVFYGFSGDQVVKVEESGQDQRPDHAMEEVIDIAVHASNPFKTMIDSGEFFRFVDRGQLTPGLFVFRFKCAGPSDYFCVCLSPTKPMSTDAFESRLRILKRQIELTGNNIRHYQGVRHLVYVDDATGLYNTRYLNHILDREIAQAEATGKSFGVLFIDVDFFKKVNDSHGHLVGTKILNEMALELKKFLRGKDTVFRYGGDEFIAVLSGADQKVTETIAERIRQSVEKTQFLAKEGLNLHVTVSIGISIFPQHAKTKKEIIDAADQAMYSIKKRSRNACVVFEPEKSPALKSVPTSTPKPKA